MLRTLSELALGQLPTAKFARRSQSNQALELGLSGSSRVRILLPAAGTDSNQELLESYLTLRLGGGPSGKHSKWLVTLLSRCAPASELGLYAWLWLGHFAVVEAYQQGSHAVLTQLMDAFMLTCNNLATALLLPQINGYVLFLESLVISLRQSSSNYTQVEACLAMQSQASGEAAASVELGSMEHQAIGVWQGQVTLQQVTCRLLQGKLEQAQALAHAYELSTGVSDQTTHGLHVQALIQGMRAMLCVHGCAVLPIAPHELSEQLPTIAARFSHSLAAAIFGLSKQ
jgi:hypothetical protein